MANEEIELNGVTYVRKDSVAQAKPTNTEGMPYVICREADAFLRLPVPEAAGLDERGVVRL